MRGRNQGQWRRLTATASPWFLVKGKNLVVREVSSTKEITFYFFFFLIDNVLLCYALLTSVRIPLSELPTVRPKCFTDRSPNEEER